MNGLFVIELILSIAFVAVCGLMTMQDLQARYPIYQDDEDDLRREDIQTPSGRSNALWLPDARQG
jgi:hypothetical protein